MTLNWYSLSEKRNILYGLGIFWIVLFHINDTFREYINFNWTLSFIIENGNVGVDVFLFLSGVSMYFFSKKIRLSKDNILTFYKSRISKIIKIYFFVCIPVLILRLVFGGFTFSIFLKELFFVNYHVNCFWYLLAIVICYLIYPIFYYIINRKRKWFSIGVGLVALYIFLLALFSYFFSDQFLYSEVLTTRIPIFALGSFCGPFVYNKQKVNTAFLFFILLILVGKGPILYFLSHFPTIEVFSALYTRLLMGLEGMGFIFLSVIIIPYFEKTKIVDFFKFLGTFTLELYVVHLSIRYILFDDIFRLTFVHQSQILMVMIIYIFMSIIISFFLHKYLMNNCFHIFKISSYKVDHL